jgi:hypothetical protein
MSVNLNTELSALMDKWRARAKRLMAEAERTARHAEIVRLTAMASTLEWAASDLSIYVEGERSSVQALSVEAGANRAPET